MSKGPGGTKVALFDLDLVFITINSTFEFVEFYAAGHFRFLKLCRFLWMQLLYFIGSGWFMKKDKRDVWLGFLAGEEVAVVRRAAEAFFKERLSRAIDPTIAGHFSDLAARGYRTVLVSASIDPVVDAFATALRFDDRFSGVLLVRDGRYTGTFADDLRGQKHDVLSVLEKKYGALDLADSYFFTDNKEDLPLAKRIGNSYGVIRGNFEHVYWEGNGIRTIPAAGGANIPPQRFLIPLVYFLFVRTASLTDKHLWFFYIGYPMFALVVCGAFSPLDAFWMVLSLAGFYALYEIGYYVNDFVSVKKEKSPTVRFDPDTKLSGFWFIANRILFFLCIIGLLFLFFPYPSGIWLYIIGNVATAAVFALHNVLRGKWRMISFPFLKVAHLLVPVLLFPQVNIAAVAAAIVLVYVPGHIFIYLRKLNHADAPDRAEMMRFVVLPTCGVIAILLVLSIVGVLSWAYVFLAAWLFIGHFVKIIKLAYRRSAVVARHAS